MIWPDPPFWSPAQARAQIWRTLLGLVLISAIFTLIAIGLVLGFEQVTQIPRRIIARADQPLTALMLFAPFLGVHVAFLVVLPLLHRRSYRSLFGPALRLNRRHFALALGMVAVMGLGNLLLTLGEQLLWPAAPEITRITPLATWLAWLPVVAGLVLIQTLAEELIFRGYLLQQLRARFHTLWICAVLPSALFGLLHFSPATWGVNAYMYVLNTAVVGVILCLVTLRTGNLGAAAGLHFGNNMIALVLGVRGELDGLTLFGLEVTPDSGYMTWSFTAVTALSLALFLAWWRWMNRQHAIANPPFGA